MEQKMNYSEAFEELRQIITEMENSEIGVDLLEARVKRASELLKICRDKLYATEQNVLEALEDLSAEN